MSVEESSTVDIISIDRKTGQVILTISDHLDWHDSKDHQMLLQRKLNSYIAFVESGEILRSYPDAKGKSITFKVVFKFRPDRDAESFLERARGIVASAGFQLRHEVFADSYDN